MKKVQQVRSKAWVLALAVVSLACVGLFWPRQPASTSSAKSTFVEQPSHSPRDEHRMWLSPLVEAPVLLTATSEKQPSVTSTRPNPLDDIRQRVMVAHPDIAQFRHLQRKVLLRPEERQMLQALYQDDELVTAARHDLLAENEKTFSEESQLKRLYRVEYLGMGLEWKDNPKREGVLAAIQDLILAQNIKSDQELELQRSLAGDKVELFMILLHTDRGQAAQLLEQVRGTDLEKLLEYAQARFDALWRLEKRG